MRSDMTDSQSRPVPCMVSTAESGAQPLVAAPLPVQPLIEVMTGRPSGWKLRPGTIADEKLPAEFNPYRLTLSTPPSHEVSKVRGDAMAHSVLLVGSLVSRLACR